MRSSTQSARSSGSAQPPMSSTTASGASELRSVLRVASSMGRRARGSRALDCRAVRRALGKRLHPQRIRRTLGAASCVRGRGRFVFNEMRDVPAEREYELRESGLTAVVRHPLLDMWAIEEMFRLHAYRPPPGAAAGDPRAGAGAAGARPRGPHRLLRPLPARAAARGPGRVLRARSVERADPEALRGGQRAGRPLGGGGGVRGHLRRRRGLRQRLPPVAGGGRARRGKHRDARAHRRDLSLPARHPAALGRGAQGREPRRVSPSRARPTS